MIDTDHITEVTVAIERPELKFAIHVFWFEL
jgi:hypothetical protein